MSQTKPNTFYFRQLLSGQDLAQDNAIAQQMVNFVYLIGDRQTGEAVVVDPAYDPAGILDLLAADGMRLVGVLATHYHPDHVGGDFGGFSVQGVSELLELASVPIHVQADEANYVTKTTGITAADMVLHHSGDVVSVGSVEVEMIHTPGHTPGSQCFLTRGCLVAGDTLFLEGCGRTDLPGSDPKEMYLSLTQRLARVPDSATLFPGHFYSSQPSAPMAETRRSNFVFMPRSVDQWMAMFGA